MQAESVGTKFAPIMMISALFPLMGAIGMGVFAPVWFLQDGGIVFSNTEKVKDKAEPTEIRSVGGWYLYILKGYAGISVIISFYTFLSEFMATNEIGGGGMEIVFMIIWPIMPFLLAFIYMPGIAVLDMIYEKRKRYVVNLAGKMGITKKVEPPVF